VDQDLKTYTIGIVVILRIAANIVLESEFVFCIISLTRDERKRKRTQLLAPIQEPPTREYN